ncbi:MAG TPA: response regulator [Bacteroidales bacterium]|nr:response regulator [Bacteroidales bacterium]
MIYILDDDERVRKGFEILLQSAGMESNSYGSVKDFLDRGQPSEQDTLVLDIHMPGMNGCDLLEYFGERNFHMPVIVVTAYDETTSRECAARYGVLAYLRKPVDGDELLKLLPQVHQETIKNPEN